ncbi:hypothetical protein [Kitasatospora acidiphila]|uniref:hypothetical protein n=1 Tax=Kitasatospora acidiphila TaxID=2567942 RepID=UPI003C73C928
MREVEARRRELASAAARQAVSAVAPEELVFFDPLAARFTRNGELPRERKYSDEATGSGWDGAVLLISPVALAMASSLYNRLLDNISDEVLKRGGHGLQRAWRRIRHTERSAPALPAEAEAPQSPPGDTELREQLLAQASELGVPEEQARALVDALLAAVRET